MARHISTAAEGEEAEHNNTLDDIPTGTLYMAYRLLMARPMCPGCGSRMGHVNSCTELARLRLQWECRQVSGADWQGMVADARGSKSV